MANVFISYSRRDTERADKVSSELAEYTHEVWIDRSDIPAAAGDKAGDRSHIPTLPC